MSYSCTCRVLLYDVQPGARYPSPTRTPFTSAKYTPKAVAKSVTFFAERTVNFCSKTKVFAHSAAPINFPLNISFPQYKHLVWRKFYISAERSAREQIGVRTLQKKTAASPRRLDGDDAAFLARPLRERDIFTRLGDRRKINKAQNIAVRKDAPDQYDFAHADLALRDDGMRRKLACRIMGKALCAFLTFEGVVPHGKAALAVVLPPGAEHVVPDWALILHIHACKVFNTESV